MNAEDAEGDAECAEEMGGVDAKGAKRGVGGGGRIKGSSGVGRIARPSNALRPCSPNSASACPDHMMCRIPDRNPNRVAP